MLKRAVFISLALLGLPVNSVSAEEPSQAKVLAEIEVTQAEATKYWLAALEAAAGNDRLSINTQRACIDLLRIEDSRIAAFNAWVKAKGLKKIDIAIERLKMIGDDRPDGDPNRGKLIADCRRLTGGNKKK